jgi:predicted aspartyl protease
VDVHIDQAGADDLACRLIDTVGVKFRVRPEADDALAAEPDIRDLVDALRRIDDPAVGDSLGVHEDDSSRQTCREASVRRASWYNAPKHLRSDLCPEGTMETATMGRVLVTAKLENLEDLWRVRSGLLQDDQAHRIEVTDALVDCGATNLLLPSRLIAQLGLQRIGSRTIRTTGGVATFPLYDSVRLTIQGRFCQCDVIAVGDDCPVLIGQVPLELLDFVIDMKNHCMIPNPEHGGEHMADMF